MAKQARKQERIPSGPLVLGSLLGWGPWSVAIGAWNAYGDSGYTYFGRSASTSAIHGLCQSFQAAFQPGICGSVDAHYALGEAMVVVGVPAFLGGMIGLFVVQQHNPRAWKQAVGPIVAGLILGILQVVAAVIVAIARAVREGGTDSSTPRAAPVAVAPRPRVPEQPGDPTTSAGQVQAQWRVRAEGGWEWLASDGEWYQQQLAPPGLLPPAPPPPARHRAT